MQTYFFEILVVDEWPDLHLMTVSPVESWVDDNDM